MVSAVHSINFVFSSMFAKQLIFLNKGSAIIYYPRSKILSKQRHISIKRCTGQITVIEIKLTRKIMEDFSQSISEIIITTTLYINHDYRSKDKKKTHIHCLQQNLYGEQTFFFLKSRTADFGNTILIATKKVQSYLNCSYRELKKET